MYIYIYIHIHTYKDMCACIRRVNPSCSVAAPCGHRK